MSASVPSWFGFGLRMIQCWLGVYAIVAQLAVRQLVKEMPEWRIGFLCRQTEW